MAIPETVYCWRAFGPSVGISQISLFSSCFADGLELMYLKLSGRCSVIMISVSFDSVRFVILIVKLNDLLRPTSFGMILSNCTIPHSGHGYVLEMTDDPGALTAMSPVVAGLATFLVGVGNGCAWAIATALRVSVLKKSLALRPGSAAFLTLTCCLGRNQLLQLKEPDKQNTSKRSEIFRSFFIVHLLVSFGKTTEKDRPKDSQSSPLLSPFIRYNFRGFQVLYRYIYYPS